MSGVAVNVDEEVAKHVDAIIQLVGPSASSVPISLYHMIRRYQCMCCVDGVPVGKDAVTGEPFVVLVKRGPHSSVPGQWWFVGGRLPSPSK